MDLTTYVRNHLIIGDGAMATQLYQMGMPVGMCYEELNVSRPDAIAAIHHAYYEAGARLIETNTFGAHRIGLERYGLDAEVVNINRAAVKVARDAVGDDAYVIGTIGSMRGLRKNVARSIDLRAAYVEQATALLLEGPDGIILETFLDLEELTLAVQVIRDLTALPIIAQLSLVDLTVTRDGFAVGDAFARLLEVGASIVGLNCRFGPADIQRAFARADLRSDLLLSAYPNAGLLSVTDGKYKYPSEPVYFGAMAKEFRDLGIRVIGGCCGTTPEHIRAMAHAVAGLSPMPVQASKETVNKDAGIVVARDRDAAPGSAGAGFVQAPLVHEKAMREHTVIVELDPPKGLSVETFLLGAQALRDAGADAVTLADNSLAVTRMSNMAMGALMKERGVEPLLHISCRDRNLIGQQSHLMGMHALGMKQILVVTGDPSRFGDLPGASSVFDVSSFDMIRMVKQLNEGMAFSGRRMEDHTSFVVGAAFNPNVPQFDKAIRRLERKVETGADFIMTQPIYDPKLFARVREATRHLPVPIFVGIMPLLSRRNAEFLHNEVPGIALSDEARRRMALYEGTRAREEGVAIARELIDAAVEYFFGIYLITPMLRYDMTVALTAHVKERTAARPQIR